MQMKRATIVPALLLFHVGLLLFFTSQLSISYYEAKTYFKEENLLHYIIHFSTAVLGENDLALRLPMILMYMVGTYLYYDVSKRFFNREDDRVWNLMIYMLLPGVSSAAIMVDGAGLVLFLLLVFLYIFKHKRHWAYALLPIYVFVDAAFAFMYLALIFYAMDKRNTPLLSASVILFGVSMYFFGIEIGGHPKNYFLSTLGIYAAIFSPIVFVYLIYALYRWGLNEEHTLLWYLGTTAFVFSLLLSFRQQMKLEELAPYLLVTTPLMVKTFLSSYRVRLRQFRGGYRILLSVGISFLLLSTVSIYLNKCFYFFIKDPSNHFVYQNHVARELAQTLRQRGIEGVYTRDKRLQLRLSFYGIDRDERYRLSKTAPQGASDGVTISYMDQDVARFFVTKFNIN